MLPKMIVVPSGAGCAARPAPIVPLPPPTFLMTMDRPSETCILPPVGAVGRLVKRQRRAMGGAAWDPRDPKVDALDWVERIPFAETRNYVQRVMENLEVYRARFGTSTVAVELNVHRVARAETSAEPAGASSTEEPTLVQQYRDGWLSENFELSDRSARLYMQLAEHRERVEAKMATVAIFTARGAWRRSPRTRRGKATNSAIANCSRPNGPNVANGRKTRSESGRRRWCSRRCGPQRQRHGIPGIS